MPPAEAAPGLGDDRPIYRSRLPHLPPRGPQALPQGLALLQPEVRLRAPQHAAGHEHPAPPQGQRVRHAAARKQKVRKSYSVLEKQFRNYFEKAEQRKGMIGENLLRMLEMRLDNVVFRMGLARSRRGAPAGTTAISPSTDVPPTFPASAPRSATGSRFARAAAVGSTSRGAPRADQGGADPRVGQRRCGQAVGIDPVGAGPRADADGIQRAARRRVLLAIAALRSRDLHDRT